jgi:hypothetical protein
MGKPEGANNMVNFDSLFDDDDLREIGADTPSPKAAHPAPAPTNPSASKRRYDPEVNKARPSESTFPRASRYESQLHPIDNRAKSGRHEEFKKDREEITGVYSMKLDESGNPYARSEKDKTKLQRRPATKAQPSQPEHPTAQQNTNEMNLQELARRVEEAEREGRMKELEEIGKRIEQARKEAERKTISTLSTDQISSLNLKIASDLGIPVESPDGIPLNAPDVYEDLEVSDEIPLLPDLPVNPFGSEMSSQVQIIMETSQAPEEDDFILIPSGLYSGKPETNPQASQIPETSKAFSDRPTSGTQNSIDAFFASIPRTNPPKQQHPVPTETPKTVQTHATQKAEDPDQKKLPPIRSSGIMKIPAKKNK